MVANPSLEINMIKRFLWAEQTTTRQYAHGKMI